MQPTGCVSGAMPRARDQRGEAWLRSLPQDGARRQAHEDRLDQGGRELLLPLGHQKVQVIS